MLPGTLVTRSARLLAQWSVVVVPHTTDAGSAHAWQEGRSVGGGAGPVWQVTVTEQGVPATVPLYGVRTKLTGTEISASVNPLRGMSKFPMVECRRVAFWLDHVNLTRVLQGTEELAALI